MRSLHTSLSLTLILLLSVATIPSTAADNDILIPHPSWDCGMPDGIPAPELGEPVFAIDMNLEQTYDVGTTQYGQRQVYVVKDGVIKGDKIMGTVEFGGLDFELTLSNGVIEIEQVLVFRTDDGSYIYARNPGVGTTTDDVRVAMDFEAPSGSASEWLNTGTYVARRTVDTAAMTLTMTVYDVSDIAADVNTSPFVAIEKPAELPYQSWEYRTASPSETRGEQIVTETVTLGGSTMVGASKRGMRNIIPITGGTLSGKITGTVVPGGADYQNLGNPATIDARYLWQTESGEIIIVRNAGPFGSLVPTFEARVDSDFAWLNSGLYQSSDPGMGAGGVSLTFYKSE